MKLPIDLLSPVRQAFASNLAKSFSADTLPGIQFTDPPGDPGLFGPDSITWRVHSHPSGIIGGFSALMLQTLHPLPMAAVTEHSPFREDPLGRLSRTASFVAAVTFGSTEVANGVIAHVNKVHTRINGTAPDGRYYSAENANLLRWVHVGFAVSLLNAHRRYNPNPIKGDDLDRYFDEYAVVAEGLGCNNIPRSRGEVRDYLHDVRGDLECGDQAKSTMAFVMTPRGPDPVSKGVSGLLIQAAVDLLPGWAQKMHGINRPPGFDALTVRPATFAMLQTLAVLMGPSPALVQARERAAATPVNATTKKTVTKKNVTKKNAGEKTSSKG